MSPVGVAEGVVDVDIRVSRQLPGEVLIVLLFLRMEAEVFQKYHITGFHGRYQRRRFRPDAVRGQVYLLLDEPGEAPGHGGQAEFRLRFSLGASQVGGDDDPRPLVQGVIQRRQGRPDPGVVGDVLGAVEGDVVVETEQDFFVFE